MKKADLELDDVLEAHLEAEMRRYFPALADFWVGSNDADCLTLNFDLNGTSLELWQTKDNMGDSDAEWFVFESFDTGRVLTLPFPGETE